MQKELQFRGNSFFRNRIQVASSHARRGNPASRIFLPCRVETWILVSKFLADQNDFDASLDAASSCDDDLVADTVRGQAVGTDAGSGTRRIFAQTLAVHRCGGTMNTA